VERPHPCTEPAFIDLGNSPRLCGCAVVEPRGLTFELTGLRRQTPTGRGRTMLTMAWSGQAVAAVAGPVVERGVRPRPSR